MEVDFVKPSVQHANKIGQWLANKIFSSLSREEDVPSAITLYIGYSKRPDMTRKYKGNVHNHKKIANCASDVFFSMAKAEWGTVLEHHPWVHFVWLVGLEEG